MEHGVPSLEFEAHGSITSEVRRTSKKAQNLAKKRSWRAKNGIFVDVNDSFRLSPTGLLDHALLTHPEQLACLEIN